MPKDSKEKNSGQFAEGYDPRRHQGGGAKIDRKRRQDAARLLDDALCAKEDGDVDLLVDAIVKGVKAGDSALVKLACHYRWGKPTLDVNMNANGPLANIGQVMLYMPDNGRGDTGE